MKTKVVTLKDIAQKAGVSITTVSHVINKTRHVNQETRENVLRILNEMHYATKESSTVKSKEKTLLLGVIIADIREDFYIALAKAIETVAEEYGVSIVLCDSEDDPEKELENIKNLLSMGVDGLVVAPVSHTPCPDDLRNASVPVILVDRQYSDHDMLFVGINNFQSAGAATEYLYSKDCRHVGFIGYDKSVFTVQQRILGYEARVFRERTEAGPRILALRYKQEDSYSMIKDFLERESFDGLVCATSDICYETLEVASELGIRIPETLKIITYDDNKWLDFLKYPISVITQPVGEIGSYAVERFIQVKTSLTREAKPVKTEVFFDVGILDRLGGR